MTTRPALVELVVADMAASLAFYRRLGIDVPADADGQPHVDAELPGGMRIAWDTVETVRSFDPDWTPPRGGHAMALAFACDDPGDVDRTHAELVDAGYRSHKDPWDAFWGMRYAVVHDPDGNPVDLFAPLPAAADQSA
ncbi:MAG: VOC family protein [Streptosporangiales bacterium]|nr:VOC family protein [Streptosporangiales bacterium]MBO0890865.1 VOC family protein [Acidothermales bacterium]